ncbi:MAG TPA: hypothetical protein VFB54_19580 [Burkholderiales bacterium]|nr:hypothetical protein [Burkholderiales bacterium]
MRAARTPARKLTFWRCDPVPKQRYCLVTEIEISASGERCVHTLHRPCADCWNDPRRRSLAEVQRTNDWGEAIAP